MVTPCGCLLESLCRKEGEKRSDMRGVNIMKSYSSVQRWCGLACLGCTKGFQCNSVTLGGAVCDPSNW